MKKFKKALAFIFSVNTALSISLNTYAVTSELDLSVSQNELSLNETEELSGFSLISQEQTIDENGFLIIDRTYVENTPSTYSTNDANSGSKTVKKSRSIYNNGSTSGDLWVIMWASGKFSWNTEKDTATVTNAKGWYDLYDLPSIREITNTKTNYDSNQGATILGGALGNKYAYVEYILTMKNEFGATQDYKLWIDVNVKGTVNFHT